MKNYYKILELPFGASSGDIKRAYYKLAFKYHPDRNNGNPVFTEIFKEINEAYLVLSDDNKRILYHAEYNNFVKGYSPSQEPIIPVSRDPYYRPTRARGPATPITDEFQNLKFAVLICFFVLIGFLLFEAVKEKQQEAVKHSSPYVPEPRKEIHLTTDEYYDILSREFMDSHDSVLYKANPDSMIHVLDSIINAGRIN